MKKYLHVLYQNIEHYNNGFTWVFYHNVEFPEGTPIIFADYSSQHVFVFSLIDQKRCRLELILQTLFKFPIVSYLLKKIVSFFFVYSYLKPPVYLYKATLRVGIFFHAVAYIQYAQSKLIILWLCPSSFL